MVVISAGVGNPLVRQEGFKVKNRISLETQTGLHFGVFSPT